MYDASGVRLEAGRQAEVIAVIDGVTVQKMRITFLLIIFEPEVYGGKLRFGCVYPL
ncbi:hypothetical protein Hdeb2414_s0013g00420061 [Helianthus debilis subsp. tardiflorus]